MSVKDVVSKYIHLRPKRITLELYEEYSVIRFSGEELDEEVQVGDVSFSEFAYGVLEAYREWYDELKRVPLTLREEIYKNDKVSLRFYPTGMLGIFDIFVDYF